MRKVSVEVTRGVEVTWPILEVTFGQPLLRCLSDPWGVVPGPFILLGVLLETGQGYVESLGDLSNRQYAASVWGFDGGPVRFDLCHVGFLLASDYKFHL